MKNSAALDNQRMIAGIGLLFCGATLLLAIPRMASSLYALYPETAYKQTQHNITTEVYQNSISHLDHALSWQNNPVYWQNKAFFHLKYLNTSTKQTPTQKTNLLEQSRNNLINSLSLSPVDPFNWLQLAVVSNELKIPKQQIIEYINSSLYAGRIEPTLIIPRLAFSYNFYNDFTEDLKNQWQKQLLIAWTINPNEVIKFIALHPDSKHIALIAFENTPEDSQKLLLELNNFLNKVNIILNRYSKKQ